MKYVWVMLRNCLSLNKGDKLNVTSRKFKAMPVFKHVIIRNILKPFDLPIYIERYYKLYIICEP